MENILSRHFNLSNSYSDISSTVAFMDLVLSGEPRHLHSCNTGGTLTSSKERKLPTRLLDIGSEAQLPRLRIKSTIDLPTTTDYLTLSRYWGSTQFVSLSSEANETFSKFIPLGSLPRTFRMWCNLLIACIVTFGLIRFEFQDSLEDWVRESSIMGVVYNMPRPGNRVKINRIYPS
jgi:hypothetical protein